MRNLLLLTCLLTLPLTSCISHWSVVHATEPTPLLGQRWFKVMNIDYSQLIVNNTPEAIYASEMDAFKLADWQADKEAIELNFAEALQITASDYSIQVGEKGDFVISPSIARIDTGAYQIPAYRAVARIYLTLEISDSEGVTLDEIQMNAKFPWKFFNASSSSRLQSMATQLGTWAGDYLIQRTGRE